MPSDAEIFHDQMLEFGNGGRLIAQMGSILARRVDYCNHRAQGNLEIIRRTYPTLPDIYFDVFDSLDCNACAFKHEGRYFIGISRGIIATFGLLFERFMGDRLILRHYGDPELERDDLPVVPISPNFMRSVELVEPFGRPIDPLRLAIAQNMFITALDFTFSHELAHIANGHLDYANHVFGISTFQELTHQSAIDDEYNWFLQTIELDADRTAVANTLSSEIRKVCERSVSSEEPIAPLYESMSSIIELWCIAVNSLARIFGDDSLECEGEPLADHPPWRLRSIGIQTMAHRIIRAMLQPAQQGVGNLEILDDVLSNTFHSLESIYSTVTGFNPQNEGLQGATSAQGWARLEQLLGRWRSMTADMQEHAFVQLIQV